MVNDVNCMVNDCLSLGGVVLAIAGLGTAGNNVDCMVNDCLSLGGVVLEIAGLGIV